MPQAVIFMVAALVAAVVFSAVLMIGNVKLFGPSSAGDRGQASAAVLSSERSWLQQRLAQSGHLEPAVLSARDWESQRLQQSGAFE
jgi:hypothetical protein